MDSSEIIAYLSCAGIITYILWLTKQTTNHCLDYDFNLAKEDFSKAEEYESRGLFYLARMYYGGF